MKDLESFGHRDASNQVEGNNDTNTEDRADDSLEDRIDVGGRCTGSEAAWTSNPGSVNQPANSVPSTGADTDQHEP